MRPTCNRCLPIIICMHCQMFRKRTQIIRLFKSNSIFTRVNNPCSYLLCFVIDRENMSSIVAFEVEMHSFYGILKLSVTVLTMCYFFRLLYNLPASRQMPEYLTPYLFLFCFKFVCSLTFFVRFSCSKAKCIAGDCV